MKEVWVDIKGFEDSHQVSNFGNVRTKDRYVKHSRGNGRRFVSGKTLTPTDNGNGYLLVGIKSNGKRQNRYIHRLVAEHFVEGKGDVVNHIDFNTKNNRCDNLEWCSQKENVGYSSDNMKRPHNTKTGLYGKGIRFKRGSFHVTMHHVYLGSYKTLEDAVKVRDNYVEEHNYR